MGQHLHQLKVPIQNPLHGPRQSLLITRRALWGIMSLSKKDIPTYADKGKTHPFLQKYDNFPNAPNPANLSKERGFLTKNIGSNFIGGKKLR